MRQDRLLSELNHTASVEKSGVKLCVVEDVILDEEPYINARPIYNRQFINAGGEIENSEAALVFNVPILYPSSQEYADWNPPKKGDTGLLIYADQSYDIWWLEGLKAINTDNTRRHNRSDCFFLPGAWSIANPMLEASPEWSEKRNMENTRRIALGKEQVHLQSNAWNLMVSDFGFDVQVKPQLGPIGDILGGLGVINFGGGFELSLIDSIIEALEATAEGLTILGQLPAATKILLAVGKLKLIKGSASPPERKAVENTRA